MKIDYSPLSQEINDEAIKRFSDTNRQSLHIVSKRTCKIIYGITIAVLAAELILSAVAGIYSKSFFAFFGALVFLSQFTALPILVALVVPLLRSQGLKVIKKTILLTEFSSRNGLYYREYNSTQSYPGIMFNIGYERKMYDQLIKESALNTFEVSNYRYNTGSNSDTQVNIGYIMVKLGRKMPHMLLDSNANNAKIFGEITTNLPLGYKFNQKLSLEGDFDKFFTLYAPKEYERDALYIFTPDLMALFIDISSQFDAEIVEDMLFVYSSAPFDMLNVDVMKSLFSIVENVGAKTFSKADRYSDEKVGCRAKNIVAVDGQRLKKHLGLAQSLLLIVVLIMFSAICLGLVGSGYLDMFKEAIKYFSS